MEETIDEERAKVDAMTPITEEVSACMHSRGLSLGAGQRRPLHLRGRLASPPSVAAANTRPHALRSFARADVCCMEIHAGRQAQARRGGEGGRPAAQGHPHWWARVAGG